MVPKVKTEHIHKQIESLKRQMEEVKAIESVLELSADKQASLTDPDARAMSTNARSSGSVGYNVQASVDTKHHLIVAHEVSMAMGDRWQLTRMFKQARESTGIKNLKVVANRSYYNMEKLKATVDEGIMPYVSKTKTSWSKTKGFYGRSEFIYNEKEDEYRCPAGESLSRQTWMREGDKIMHRYWSKNCGSCELKPKYTTGKERRVTRWEHAKVLNLHDDRMNQNPTMMQLRKQTVEHAFGTIKS